MVFAQGDRRDRLQETLLNQAKQQPPYSFGLPESFQHYRQELGAQVYGAMGIARDDKVNRQLALLRNYEFFGAPVVGIVCMHQDLGVADALSVGMYLLNAGVVPNRSRHWHLRRGFASGLSRNYPQRIEHPIRIIDYLWFSRWLFRS
ncbi:hypothetical protein [Nostoc sp.]|uniref:hypothetical protein n=1 Tax=Nostoc sp. TaxID=1180 RepID=UPI002FF5D22E